MHEALCLIPVTRDAQEAIRSAEDQGWAVITLEDRDRFGANRMRNKLFDLAKAHRAKLIRYCDDDDLVCGVHPSDCSEGVTYFHHCLTISGLTVPIRFGSQVGPAIFGIGPWSWVASMETLLAIEVSYGTLWDESKTCRQGSWMWTRFLEQGGPLRLLDAIGYHWRRAENGINSHPDRTYQDRLIEEWCAARKLSSL